MDRIMAKPISTGLNENAIVLLIAINLKYCSEFVQLVLRLDRRHSGIYKY